MRRENVQMKERAIFTRYSIPIFVASLALTRFNRDLAPDESGGSSSKGGRKPKKKPVPDDDY